MQIDETILKVSAILRKARNIKNCLVPINRIPAETLALIATLLPRKRDLINATAVCQQWRMILLSFPRLWCNADGSSSELEAHLERSKSVPIQVNLSSPQLIGSITPHTSRLVDLTVWVDDLLDFDDIRHPLRYPIPTLRSFGISTKNPRLHTLALPPGIGEDLFLHLKELRLNGISSLNGPQTFPHITELFLSTNAGPPRSASALLNTLERLPGLEKVHAVFRSCWHPEFHLGGIVTLPRVQEMYLSVPNEDDQMDPMAIPPILQHLKLPNLTSLTVDSPFSSLSDPSILPVTSFAEQLPNYVELPEVRIDTTMLSGKLVFRSPSQAVITLITGAGARYKWGHLFWGDLPLTSVRRVTAILVDPELGGEDEWLVDVLTRLDLLELLELGGDCGLVLRRLRRRMALGVGRVDIQTLIVRGGGYAKSQALKLESVKGDLGLQNMAVTYIQDPDAESASDDEDWYEDSDG